MFYVHVGRKKADVAEMKRREDGLGGGGDRMEEWEVNGLDNGERTFEVYALLLPERGRGVL